MNLLLIFLFSSPLFGVSLAKSGWWNYATIYDIFVWSFKDSNDDGIGDIKGVVSKLEYLRELGISAIKLSQIFSSPDEITDFYAIDNFQEIHSTLGTMSDFDELIKEAKARNIKVILDINLNHCHESHEWFQKSMKKIEPYSDFFVWSYGKTNTYFDIKQPPNRWKNTLQKSAWQWNEKRKQFFYNHYNPFSPDLNMRSTGVKNAILNILKFWLDKGVYGFNLLNINTYFEDSNPYNFYASDIDYKSDLKFIQYLRSRFDYYNKVNFGEDRILMTTITEHENTLYQMVFNENPVFDLVTVSKLSSFNEYSITPTDFFTNEIKSFIDYTSKPYPLEWLLESPNHRRIANHNKKEMAEALLSIQLVLPGAMRMYYGTELGMSEYFTKSRKCVNMQWEYSDSRTLPMQWDSSANAGFSTNQCVIQKPNPDYQLVNVESEKNDLSSTYNFVKNLLKLRQNDVLKYGDIYFAQIYKLVLIVIRTYKNKNVYTIVNLNNISEDVYLYSNENYSNSVEVLAVTPNALQKRGNIFAAPITISMRPMSSIILQYNQVQDH